MSLLEQALQLAAEGFWLFPIKAGEKTPAVKAWPGQATRDEEVLREWFATGDRNIGIATGVFADGAALIAVDVDNKNGKNGDEQLFRLELDGSEFPRTREQRTPTGGRHLLYRVAEACKQGVDVLGPGLDIRSRGGYVVGAGSAVAAGVYETDNAPIADAPAWLVDRLGRAVAPSADSRMPVAGVDAGRAFRRATDYLATAPLAREGEGGDAATYKVAARLKDLGATQEQASRWMLEHWNDRCDPPWEPDELAAKVAHAFRYGQEPPGIDAPEAVFSSPIAASESADEGVHPFGKLNQEYAYVVAGGGHILWETTDHNGVRTLMHLDVTTFHTKLAAQRIQIGERWRALTKAWIDAPQRRTYDGFVFAPGRQVDARWYNLWRGFTVEPAATADHPMVKRFLDHALQNVCQGDHNLFRRSEERRVGKECRSRWSPYH